MFSNRFRQLTPYTPGEQPQNRKFIKLNTNENPYPPSPLIEEHIKKADTGKLNLYPDPSSKVLREAVADYFGISSSMVYVGNGSDEVLSFCFFAFFDEDRGPLLFPEHTYSFYPVYCGFYNIPYKRIPLEKNYSISVDSYLSEDDYCGIIFPNPNAPTGIYLDLSEIKRLMKGVHSNRVVIIDEAYIDFGGQSAASFIEKFDNLLIVQTLSKSRSLAGLRVGYAIGNENLITALTIVKDSVNSYPLDRLSQDLGVLAMEDRVHYKENAARIIDTRESVTAVLKAKHWEVLPSMSNFIFIRKQGVKGLDVYAKLKEEGVLVRYFGLSGISDFVRVTIGKKEDMDIFIELLTKFF